MVYRAFDIQELKSVKNVENINFFVLKMTGSYSSLS